ncbi:MAG TPA: hypothetical protein VIK19_01535, partial [Syntrophales bacterium]
VITGGLVDEEDADGPQGTDDRIFPMPHHTSLPNPTAARSSPERRPSARVSSEGHDACLFDPVPRHKKHVRLKPAFAVALVSAATTKR